MIALTETYTNHLYDSPNRDTLITYMIALTDTYTNHLYDSLDRDTYTDHFNIW